MDDLYKQAKQLGPGCYGYKKDMARAFGQISIDPLDWYLLGLYWQGTFFLDKAAMMGCRTAWYICQWVTNVIRQIMTNWEYYTKNYMDDFMGLEKLDRVWQAHEAFGNLL